AAANRLQLIEAGVDAGRIDDLALCTGCRTDLFYSHRMEGEPTGRFGASIVLV
ncbi:MAG TPA: laccase domain-containing protein, partial [Dehalococcoidia bacterium]|nr:laccase domain-containing protein [Dehalococcoidia bacterium]